MLKDSMHSIQKKGTIGAPIQYTEYIRIYINRTRFVRACMNVFYGRGGTPCVSLIYASTYLLHFILDSH